MPGRRLGAATSLRLEELLAVEPCPVCAAADERAESWFATYEHETNPDPDMKIWLAGSYGLCTAHTRRLLDSGTSTSWLASGLFAEVARAGVRRMSAGRSGPARTCPPCAAAAERVAGLLDLLRTGLARDPRVRDAYSAGSGVCLTHLAELVRGAPAHVVHLAAERAARTLAAGAAEALGVLAGADADRRRRRRLWAPHREAVLRAEEQAVKTSTAAYVDLLLDTPACPLCTATQRAEWRLLDWLATCDVPATALQLDATLCGRHLGDLAAVGWPERADELALYNADRVLAALHPAIDQLAALRTGLPHRRPATPPAVGRGATRPTTAPPPATDQPTAPRPATGQGAGSPPPAGRGATPPTTGQPATPPATGQPARPPAAGRGAAPLAVADRVVGALRGGLPRWRAAARALAPVFRPLPCRACRVAGLAERDERRLLTIVAEDASRRDQLARAHGLCLAHGRALDDEGALPPAWRDLLHTRLQLLGFELDRAARQTARDGRWRTRGSELTAWTQAPTLLDGAVYGPRVDP